MSYLLLFASAFLAATILPFSSEILLLGLVTQGHSLLLLWLVATVGNTLGAVLNWWLGGALLRFQNRRWFYFTPRQIDRAQAWFGRYGKWSLLFAWLPVIGDALTLVAGIMRIPPGFFTVVVGLGKASRYALLILLWQLAPV